MTDNGIQTVPDSMPNDTGTADNIAATVAAAIAEANARNAELMRDIMGQGDSAGDLMPLPPVGMGAAPSDA